MVHGGAILTFIDMALFAGGRLAGRERDPRGDARSQHALPQPRPDRRAARRRGRAAARDQAARLLRRARWSRRASWSRTFSGALRKSSQRAVTAVAERYRALVAAGELGPIPTRRRRWRCSTGSPTSWRETRAQGRPDLAPRRPAEPPPGGVYLWGGVGRGKSMLMDLAFETIDHAPKRRVHFHEFMLEVHERLRAERAKEEGDPIPPVAEAIAAEAKLLCFDEMVINNAADAMILSRLFAHLLEAGVTVDHHLEPAARRPLSRRPQPRALPALHRPDRARAGGGAAERPDRLPARAARRHADLVRAQRPGGDRGARARPSSGSPTIRSRTAPRCRPRIWRCPAAARCTCPRASRASPSSRSGGCAARRAARADYLAVARHYHTVILVGIPRMGPENRNEAARFVTLIDALYEHKVKLLAAADAEPQDALRRRRRRLRVRTHRLAPDRDAERGLSGAGARRGVRTLACGRTFARRGRVDRTSG